MNTEIKLVQVPVIQHALVAVGKSVTSRLAELNIDKLVATEDTIKSLKELRADLNKELTNYEAQRKAVKEAVANPYVEFEGVYKTEISEKYKQAIDVLKDKIGAFENKIKVEKKANISRYFEELCASEEIDFLNFDHVGLEINLSTSEKQYKDRCNEFVLKVKDDVSLINSVEYPSETMAEYKTTLNASKAITSVRERKEREKQEAIRLKVIETSRRELMLRGIGLSHDDMTKSFIYSGDESVYCRNSDIENLSKEEFHKKFSEIESIINELKRVEKQKQQDLFSAKQPEEPIREVKTPEPIHAPAEVVQPIKEEVFTASFEVSGTMSQLKALGNFMKQNNINYKNI